MDASRPAPSDPRSALAALIEERGEDFASLSRLLGRNAAYVQQFIRRGVPRKLDEADRRTLARYFDVPESLLGGLPGEAPRAVLAEAVGPRYPADVILVPRLNIGASAGSGALGGDERPTSRVPFHGEWLRALAGGTPTAMSIIRVEGDSMVPTLGDGDDILVDRSDAGHRLRDGIYVLRVDEALIVKRVAMHPGRRFTIRSDNPAYPAWTDCDPTTIEVIGRVVWVGRRVS